MGGKLVKTIQYHSATGQIEKESLKTLSSCPCAWLSLKAILTVQFPLSQILIFCSSYLLHRETNVLCSGNLIPNDEYEIVLSSDSSQITICYWMLKSHFILILTQATRMMNFKVSIPLINSSAGGFSKDSCLFEVSRELSFLKHRILDSCRLWDYEIT